MGKKEQKAKNGTGNKHLDAMLENLKAKKSVVVFTTERKHYKKNLESPHGFGVSDLKKKFYDAYKYLLVNHDVKARMLNMSEFQVEWVVELK
jgi:hypothetical protein